MVTVLLTVVLALVIVAFLLVDVRLAMWVIRVARDDRDERRDAELMPELVKAHKQLREQNARLKELEEKAERVQRHLWGIGTKAN